MAETMAEKQRRQAAEKEAAKKTTGKASAGAATAATDDRQLAVDKNGNPVVAFGVIIGEPELQEPTMVKEFINGVPTGKEVERIYQKYKLAMCTEDGKDVLDERKKPIIFSVLTNAFNNADNTHERAIRQAGEIVELEVRIGLNKEEKPTPYFNFKSEYADTTTLVNALGIVM